MPTQAVFIGRNLEQEQTAIIQQLQACQDS